MVPAVIWSKFYTCAIFNPLYIECCWYIKICFRLTCIYIPKILSAIAFKTQFKASRVSNLRMINVHNFPHKCSKSCSTLFWDSKSSLWIHLLSVDTSPKCYCLQHQYCIHHPQCHLYLKSLVQKKQQPVMRLFYNVLINYLDFFCFSKLPMIKITFNINYLNFFCSPKLLRVAFNYLHILLLWLTYWHAEAAFY